MKISTCAALCLSFLPAIYASDSNLTKPLSLHQILPNNFKPPQVFKNVNLVRSVNLDKGYVKETVNVVIQNTDAKSQNQYYVPFKAEVIGKVGGFEVRDKKDPEKPAFKSDVVEYDSQRYTSVNQISYDQELTTS